MSNRNEFCKWIGKPVGVALVNGQGVAGVLCDIRNGEIFLLQFLNGTQFATFHFPLRRVRTITRFPSCNR
ncbi:hypothetical protein [Paenibacillus sp. MBLB4367]|uniref:hypothetical protein n=1 Tax=Paenibacillus sp. MBLB4367 TaxID=3384767 RepID=UPI003908152A